MGKSQEGQATSCVFIVTGAEGKTFRAPLRVGTGPQHISCLGMVVKGIG